MLSKDEFKEFRNEEIRLGILSVLAVYDTYEDYRFPELELINPNI